MNLSKKKFAPRWLASYTIYVYYVEWRQQGKKIFRTSLFFLRMGLGNKFVLYILHWNSLFHLVCMRSFFSFCEIVFHGCNNDLCGQEASTFIKYNHQKIGKKGAGTFAKLLVALNQIEYRTYIRDEKKQRY